RKCSVSITFQSKCLYWTWFLPKYPCALSGLAANVVASAATASQVQRVLIHRPLPARLLPSSHRSKAARADRTRAALDGRRAPRNRHSQVVPSAPVAAPPHDAPGPPPCAAPPARAP